MTSTVHDPREAVLARLDAQHDHFIVEERARRKAGQTDAAEGAHVLAIRLLRAYIAEHDDPPVVKRP